VHPIRDPQITRYPTEKYYIRFMTNVVSLQVTIQQVQIFNFLTWGVGRVYHISTVQRDTQGPIALIVYQNTEKYLTDITSKQVGNVTVVKCKT
jgi:hypothetical protein